MMTMKVETMTGVRDDVPLFSRGASHWDVSLIVFNDLHPRRGDQQPFGSVPVDPDEPAGPIAQRAHDRHELARGGRVGAWAHTDVSRSSIRPCTARSSGKRVRGLIQSGSAQTGAARNPPAGGGSPAVRP